MFTREENAILTSVVPDAPLHPFLARFWYPVATSDQLADRHTRHVRLLGENYVLARQGAQLIALEEMCPHRQASLTLARVEDSGLRCIYHGWVMDREGRVVETPNERETGGRSAVRVRAPAVREAGGMIWMNVCEKVEQRVPFPALPWFGLPAEQVVIAQVVQDGNWLQALEGAIDSSHSSHLHSSEILSEASMNASRQVGSGATAKHARPSVDRHPRIKVRDTDFGFVYGALRTPMVNPESTVYVRATACAFPSYVTFPANTSRGDMQIFVPVDDTHLLFFYIRYSHQEALDRGGLLERSGLVPGKHLDANNRLFASGLPNWGQNRESMAQGESFTGLVGVNLQDVVVQESMGTIVDRSREHVGAADLAIVHFRRLLLAAAHGQGAGAPGAVDHIDYRGVRARDGLLPIAQDWTTIYQPDEVPWQSEAA